MPTIDELKAAPRATVVEPGAWPGRSVMWELYHYEHGQPAGRSIAVHKDLHAWLRDLESQGRMLGFGWEIRGQEPPADWPGWPVRTDPPPVRDASLDGLHTGREDAAAREAAKKMLTRKDWRRDDDDA